MENQNAYIAKIRLILANTDKPFIREFCETAQLLIECDPWCYPTVKQKVMLDKWHKHYKLKMLDELGV